MQIKDIVADLIISVRFDLMDIIDIPVDIPLPHRDSAAGSG
ncbi:hypothetical protein [Breoghania sp.]|nr:hypothetical protein [Breoghania sp.]MDJ0931261.1 hypothetical protein [Breoghania sp.]